MVQKTFLHIFISIHVIHLSCIIVYNFNHERNSLLLTLLLTTFTACLRIFLNKWGWYWYLFLLLILYRTSHVAASIITSWVLTTALDLYPSSESGMTIQEKGKWDLGILTRFKSSTFKLAISKFSKALIINCSFVTFSSLSSQTCHIP